MGDECVYIYGDTSSAGGTFFPDHHGTHYFIQEEFSNQEYALNA